jgi:Cdc6-like AAA superfamily ATPase
MEWGSSLKKWTRSISQIQLLVEEILMKQVFIGREQELTLMLGNYRQVLEPSSHTPRVILVSGEAGVGKTELINQFSKGVKKQAELKNNTVWVCLPNCESTQPKAMK